MSNELTYILGAGASYQSIPVVKTFPKRFDSFVYQIALLERDSELFLQNQIKPFLNSCRIFSNAIQNHQSFDTYFKKLFHTNHFDLINESKIILNIYFIWEHLQKRQSSNKKNSEEQLFEKKAAIDKRYDALIAGLLKPNKGKAEVFCKTNFITWNYDLNLFFSLKNYFAPEKTTRDFLNSITIDEYEWNIENQISVINMNGYFYSSKFNNYISLNNEDGMSLVKELITTDILENEILKDAAKIKFAWEIDSKHAKVAEEKIVASKNIVVIGYTFPLYNRLVDFKYLSHNDFGTHKKIVIQDPNSTTIRQNLIDLFEINDNEYIQENVVALLDCDSFYVPSNIYGINRNNEPSVW